MGGGGGWGTLETRPSSDRTREGTLLWVLPQTGGGRVRADVISQWKSVDPDFYTHPSCVANISTLAFCVCRPPPVGPTMTLGQWCRDDTGRNHGAGLYDGLNLNHEEPETNRTTDTGHTPGLGVTTHKAQNLNCGCYDTLKRRLHVGSDGDRGTRRPGGSGPQGSLCDVRR